MAKTAEGTTTQVAGRLKRLRTMVLTMLCITGVINYLDRGPLAVANPLIRSDLGLVASVPFLFGIPGSVAGGFLSDRLAATGMVPILSRKLPIMVGMIGMAAFTVPSALTSSTSVAVSCIALAVFRGTVTSADVWTLATTAAPPSYVASLGSIPNFGGYLGGSFAPWVTGLIVERSGSFAPAMIAGAMIAVVSSVV